MDNFDNQEGELRNPFPSPPSHYNNYTTHNLHLLRLLETRTVEQVREEADQHEILSDQEDVPDWSLYQLEKPRVDWILEDGHYTVFGDTWFITERIPSLGELGGQQLYPSDPTVDRRPALITILRSLLATYSSLLGSLLAPPPTTNDANPPVWQSHLTWMTIMSQNIMSAANDLRPVQARYNLENMMKSQLGIRRKETMSIHQRCDTLEKRLAELKNLASSAAESTKVDSVAVVDTTSSSPLQQFTLEDVSKWAEES